MVEPSFAELLAQALADYGVSKTAAAATLGVDRTTLHRWLSGAHEPSIAQRDGLAGLPRALGMSPAESARFLAAATAALGYDLRRRPSPPAPLTVAPLTTAPSTPAPSTPAPSTTAPSTTAHRLNYGSDDLPPFAGRAAELAELQQHVLARRAVLITGLGGLGKTRLAQELLHTCAGAFHHGCECLTLTGEDGGQVLRHVAGLLGIDLRPEDVTAENRHLTLGRLRSQLESVHLLFLVDNVANAEQVRDLAQGLRAITWVFTARRVGLRQIGVHPLHLRPPDTGEARAIFRAHLPAAAVPDRDDDRLVGRVVDKVGRLPIALHLAAAVVGNRQAASVAELDAWLEAEGLGRAGAPRRKLERLFDSMLAAVPPTARRALLLCGIFPTPLIRLTTAQDVGAAAGLRPTPDDWGELVDYSLVDQPDDSHVALHTLVHAHAAKRLAAQPYAAAVREAFIAHFLALAESVSLGLDERQRDYRPFVGQERELLAAAETLHAARDWPRLGRMWPALSGYLWRTGDHEAFARLDGHCLAAARALGDEGWAAVLLSELGYVKKEAGAWSEAEALFQEAQALHDTAPGDAVAQARLRRYRAEVALGQGDYDGALALLDEAEGRLAGADHEPPPRRAQATMLLHSARMTAHHRRGALAEAAAAGQAAASLYPSVGSYDEFRVELGDILFRLGRPDEAARQWRALLAARATLPQTPDDAEAQLRLAWLAAARGAPAEAARLARAAQQTLERHGRWARAEQAGALSVAADTGAARPEFDALFAP